MDVQFFFNERVDFAVQLRQIATSPYRERIRKIENKEDPYIGPGGEHGEPPFMAEWQEARDSIQVIAYSCIAMLSSALHLYFETWVQQTGLRVDDISKRTIFRDQGWLAGYLKHFGHHLGLSFESCPADVELLKQVVLARNRIEHPSAIAAITAQHSECDLKKMRHPYFVDDREIELFATLDAPEREWLLPPTLHVTEDSFLQAVSEAKTFVDWFEPKVLQRA